MSTPISLSDDCEGSNDRFIIDIDKWEAMRKRTSSSDGNRFPSIGSLQTDDRTYQVELWEDGRNTPRGKVKRSLSIQSNISSGTVDRLLDEAEHLQQVASHTIFHESPPASAYASNEEGNSKEERALSPSIVLGWRSARSAGSKFNVRFNLLDTISEQEAAAGQSSQSRPNSTLSSMGSSTDRLIEGVEENFPKDQQ